MKQKEIRITVAVYTSAAELAPADQRLLEAARLATANAYAPYSKFLVGAVAQLANGATVAGTNQENAAYPVGICAERTLLSAVASQFPGVGIDTIAISYNNTLGESARPISPCGICRQTLTEYEQRTQQAIRLIMSGQEGEVYVLNTAKDLLPLSFSAADMAPGV